MIDSMVSNFQIYLLVFVRITAMIEVAPLFNSKAIPQTAKIGFAIFVSAAVFPWILKQGYALPESAVDYFLIVLGEALIGIISGFFLVLIY